MARRVTIKAGDYGSTRVVQDAKIPVVSEPPKPPPRGKS